MHNKLLIAVSALAIMAGVPAMADTTVKTETTSNPSIKQDLKEGWENTKEAVSDAADKTSEAAEDAYENIRATFVDENEASSGETVTIDPKMTASGMIGKPVLNTSGEKIATLHDIILDANGNAKLAVLADGGFMGIGTKLAAFDYALVSQRQKDGDVIIPVSEETLDKVSAFSYDSKDAKEKDVKIIPADDISVAKLLDGQILNTRQENMAEIDNLSFKDGKANQVIIAFDQTLGLGGEKATMSYDGLKLIRDKDAFDFQLSAKQQASFENFKKTATN